MMYFSKAQVRLSLVLLRNFVKNLWFRVRYKKVDLVTAHFSFWSLSNHVNRNAFQYTLHNLNNQRAHIIETGTAAWGTGSTRLWDSYVRKYGGSLISVDIRPEASAQLTGQLSRFSKCVVSDSVAFLSGARTLGADLYFLDSWDVDWANPHDSALHGLAEYEAISGHLRSGNLVLIDDTPASTKYIPVEYHCEAQLYLDAYQVLPGKGALVLKQILKSSEFEVLFHEYALLFRKK